MINNTEEGAQTVKETGESNNKIKIIPMAQDTERVWEQRGQRTLESLCRPQQNQATKASQKPAPKLDNKLNQSFVGQSLLKALRKQAARSQATRSQATKDRMEKNNIESATIIFFDET